MTKPSGTPSRSFAHLMRSASPVALGVAVAVSAAAATAQTAPAAKAGDEAAVQEFVVTGYRAALANAAKVKLNADRIVESVSAEDIGKLPQNSIADAIASLPGITTQRLGGRDNEITIRGFSADYSTTLLNGREQVSTNDNRSVDFDQYPAEIINRVDVYKTPDAGLVGQGLSGTVNMQTIRPLEYGKKVFVLGARGEIAGNGALNSGTNDKGYRVNGMLVDQFSDGKLGVSLGVSHDSSPQQYEQFNAWGYPTIGSGAYVIGGSKSFVVSSQLERTAVVGTIEYKPTPELTTTFDGLYTHFNNTETDRGIELPLQWSSASLAPGYTTAGGVVNSGAFTGVKGVLRNDANQRKADEFSLGWNATYVANGWTAVADVSVSHVSRDELVLETYAGTGRNAVGATDTIGFTQTPNGFIFSHGLNYADPNLIQLTSPQGWGGNIGTILNGQDGYSNTRHVVDDLETYKVSAKKELHYGAIKDIEVGLSYSDRSKDLTPVEYFLGLKANTNGTTSVPIPAAALLAPTNLRFLGLGPVVSFDPIKLVNSGLYNQIANPNADVSSKAFSVHEHVFTAHLMADIDQQLGFADLTGNVGVQFIHTNQGSTGTVATGSPITSSAIVHDHTEYNDVLPSLNLALRFPERYVVRLGAAREMMRPRLIDMAATSNFGFNQSNGQFSGSGGNPYLRPWRANAVDVSVEKYFGSDGAYVAAAGFYKNLESYITTQFVPFNFTGYPVPSNFVGTPVFAGFFNVPTNGKGGDLYGVEFSGNAPLKTFIPALAGFGINGSFSITESQIATADPQTGKQSTHALPNYSKYTGNVTGYWEHDGLSLRINARYRSSYLGDLSGFGALQTYRRARAETMVDAQAGYEFKEGRLKGLAFLFQAQNLTDQPFTTIDPSSNLIIDYQRYGRRFLFGANYKF